MSRNPHDPRKVSPVTCGTSPTAATSIGTRRRPAPGRSGEARVARLQGYRLAFNKRASKAGRLYANIIPDSAGETWGVIYRCRPEAIARMDEHEGVALGHYEHRTVPVETTLGEVLDALAYIATDGFTVEEGRPAPDYLARILRGAGPTVFPTTTSAALRPRPEAKRSFLSGRPTDGTKGHCKATVAQPRRGPGAQSRRPPTTLDPARTPQRAGADGRWRSARPCWWRSEELTERTVRDRYLVGVLAPRPQPQPVPAKVEEEDDEETPLLPDELSEGGADTADDGTTDKDVPIVQAHLPSSFGLTFCVDKSAKVAEGRGPLGPVQAGDEGRPDRRAHGQAEAGLEALPAQRRHHAQARQGDRQAHLRSRRLPRRLRPGPGAQAGPRHHRHAVPRQRPGGGQAQGRVPSLPARIDRHRPGWRGRSSASG